MRRREKPYLPLKGYEHFMYAWNETSFLVLAKPTHAKTALFALNF